MKISGILVLFILIVNVRALSWYVIARPIILAVSWTFATGDLDPILDYVNKFTDEEFD